MGQFESSIYNKILEGTFDSTILKTCNLVSQLSINVDSKVYLFMDEDKREKYTLKHIENYKQFFSEETLALIKEISHPSIAPILDVITDGDHLYVVKKYIEGPTLDEILIQDRVLLDSDTNYIMTEIAKILKYLHGRDRLIHRDIKPSNLVFTKEGQIILIDLMSIRSFKESQSGDTVYIGTSKYAAPEQFGYSQTDERTDIYNLGATIKLILGDYKGDSKEKEIVEKCLSFNPKDRYQSIDALMDALDASRLVKKTKSKTRTYLSLISKVVMCLALITLGLFAWNLNKENYGLSQDYESLESAHSDLLIQLDEGKGYSMEGNVHYRNVLIMPHEWVHIVGAYEDPIYDDTEAVLGLNRRINAYGPSLANNMQWLEMTADVFIYSTYNPYQYLPSEIKALIDMETFNGIQADESIKLDYFSDSEKHMKILIVNPPL